MFEKTSSDYKGVSWDKGTSSWIAQLSSLGNHYYLGRFPNEFEAAMAVNHKCKELDIPLRNHQIVVTTGHIERFFIFFYFLILFLLFVSLKRGDNTLRMVCILLLSDFVRFKIKKS